ncbi:MAG: anti-repressor SinI family protein [Bacillota bacterium]|nr:anti-repressor SinI family protein [Bacillota bacterium]
MLISEKNVNGLDEEWMSLILEAKNMGIEMELIREFIQQNRINESLTYSD